MAAPPRRRGLDPGILLYLAPILWGATFPAAKVGLEAIGILPFMAWTRVLGFVTILAAVPFVARRDVSGAAMRRVALPGMFLGALIFVAYLLQTVGLSMTTATNAGFITGLYVVFTPLLGLVLFRRGARRSAWIAVVVSLLGMTLLSVARLDAFRIGVGDLLVFASALAWAGHVVGIEYFATRHPSVLLSLAQMGATAVLHLAVAAPFGLRTADVPDLWVLLVITGVLGSGVAYTLQVVAQRTITATRAVVILAGEAVAAAAISFVWLGERLQQHQWAGAALVLVAMVVSELGARREDLEAEAAKPV